MREGDQEFEISPPVSCLRSFWYGHVWAVVEPVVGVLGAPAVLIARPILPYAFDFAAGAMIFVVVEEVVSESQRSVLTQKRRGIYPE